jgi:hypothetical protein
MRDNVGSLFFSSDRRPRGKPARASWRGPWRDKRTSGHVPTMWAAYPRSIRRAPPSFPGPRIVDYLGDETLINHDLNEQPGELRDAEAAVAGHSSQLLPDVQCNIAPDLGPVLRGPTLQVDSQRQALTLTDNGVIGRCAGDILVRAVAIDVAGGRPRSSA